MEEQQKIADEVLEHQAEIEAKTRVEEGTREYSEADLASPVFNGRSVAEKVEFCQSLFRKEVPVSSVFNKNEMIDVTNYIKGHGYKGELSPVGVHQVAEEDTSWSQEGCVHWNMASSPCSVASALTRSIRFPSPRRSA